MEDLSKYPGLFVRNTKWYVRKATPKELKYLHNSDFKASLGTSELAEAKKLYHHAMLEIQGKIESLFQEHLNKNAEREDFLSLPKDQLIALAYSWYNSHKSKHSKIELKNSIKSYSDKDVRDAVINLEVDLHNHMDALNQNNFDSLYPRIPVWLKSNGYDVDQNSLNYAVFCKHILQSLIFDTKQHLNRLNNGSVSSQIPPIFIPYAASGVISKRISLIELVEDYLAQPNKKSISPKNKSRYYSIVGLLNSHAGCELYADEIDREFLQRHRNKLTVYPSKAAQKFKNVGFDEVLEVSKNDKSLTRLSIKSVNTHIYTISALLEHAELNGYIDKNPAVKLALIDAEPNSQKRNPWSLENLIKIYNTSLCDLGNASRFSGSKYNEALYWFQLLSLWTGLSSKEIAMLYVSDIKEEDNITYIDVVNKVDDKGSLVKTKNSFRVRKVPIHRELVKMGFLDFVGKVKHTEWVFSDLYWNENNSRGQKVGEHFTRYCKKCNIVQEKCSFHSFRHNYRDALRDTEMNKEIALALGGWSKNEGHLVADDYGQGYSLKKLNENLQKIQYEGLDLSHLYT